ncbi:Nudix family hydrolase [Alkalimarinus alittae]|uniref:8-oxo-dGTP diphosphatase n=1 Tax=Alkalimarinus alittae TaxID=2961619 RepID=A0ABY6N0D6_9ALTE|nr:Nudix family hydrolase [Alkalimarinus alittae]UZE95549.1 Nudix family hydrolase [Alkalimarinus alittae]
MSLVHVAVAVIMRDNEVLIARRPDGVHQGGLWEFPGGKLEKNESVQHALKRELKEELDIEVDVHAGVEPLIRIHHDYGDKAVLLDVWVVSRFSGVAKGAEGQPIKWVEKANLTEFDFPAANRPIISAIMLPHKYLITGGYKTNDDCIQKLQNAILHHDITLVQFRHHELYLSDRTEYIKQVKKIKGLCDRNGARLILNAQPSILHEADADGVHLTFAEARGYNERPVATDKWFGVSCHNKEELAWVSRLSPDYALLSPIKETSTHPEAMPLGWTLFRALTDQVAFPVFALGGMQETDINTAITNGAQGIAAISAWW